MLRSARHVTGYEISARDGMLGKVKDFLFDDESWTVRYLVVDSGTWLPGRRVLIRPATVGQPDWERGVFPVGLSREQVEKAPGIEEDQPVSRQYEIELHRFYGWSPYWAGAGSPAIPPPDPEEVKRGDRGDPHLRSAKEVTGYHVSATDGSIGHVEDLILDDRAWILRYLVVDTRNWLPGRKVLVSTQWFRSIDWTERAVDTDLSKEQVRASPEYDPEAPVNRRYEERLYDFYGRPGYWRH